MASDSRWPAEPDPLPGLPVTAHNPSSWEGSVEQDAKLAAGLRSPRDGWRRLTARIGLSLLALTAVALIIFGVLGAS